MKKKYVIQEFESNLYFYGFYTSGKYTSKISQAKTFSYFEEAEEFIAGNLAGKENIENNHYTIISVYQ